MLGQTWSHCPASTRPEAGKRFLGEFEKQLNNHDSSAIRGEYKLWVYKCYLVPSFHFSLAVDAISESTLQKMQAYALGRVKNWL